MRINDYILTAGAVADGGTLRRLPAPQRVASPGHGREIIAIHRPYGTPEVTRLIVADRSCSPARLLWCDTPHEGTLPDYHTIGPLGTTASGAGGALAVTTGVTLTLAGAGGLRRLRMTPGGYDDLGEGLPRFDVEFRLVREPLTTVSRRITADLGDTTVAAAVAEAIRPGADGVSRLRLSAGERHATAVGSITDEVTSLLAEVTGTEVTARGRFWQPLMARCGLRLADGSMARCTPPELLLPSDRAPRLTVSEPAVDTDALTLTAVTGLSDIARCRLEMRITGADSDRMTLWADYIGGLDVAVTEPIYTYDPTLPVTGWDIPGYDESADPCWLLGEVSDADMTETVTGRSVFRQIVTIKPDRLAEMAASGEWTRIEPEPGTLTALTTAPPLPDTLRADDDWDAGAMTVHGGRLIVAPARRILPEPPPLAATVAVEYSVEGERVESVRVGHEATEASLPDIRWLYVGDPDARSVTLGAGDTERTYPLTRHTGLNGAYWYGGLRGERTQPPAVAATTRIAARGTASCGGLLLSSPAGSPLTFATGGAVRLPCRRIVGLRGALRPMSEGQFGSWPLYAFTDSGVTALSPGTDGLTTWESQRQITPRGAVSGAGVTAVESGVAYVTGDGAVMLLSGSSLTRLDTPCDRLTPLQAAPEQLPGLSRVAEWTGLPGIVDEWGADLRDQAARTVLAYDPVFGLLIAFRRGESLYARVWHMRGGATGLLAQGSAWTGAVTPAEGSEQPLFTDTAGGSAWRLSDAPDSAPVLAVSGVITSGDRPYRHGMITLGGSRPGGREGVTIYGSNDLTAWLPVASAAGARLPAMASGTPRRGYVAAVASRRATVTADLHV